MRRQAALFAEEKQALLNGLLLVVELGERNPGLVRLALRRSPPPPLFAPLGEPLTAEEYQALLP